MKVYNVLKLNTTSGDSYAKNALLIYGGKDNIWEGKRLETCTENMDAVLLRLAPGEVINAHHHGESEEIVYMLEGSGEITQENSETKKLKSGDLVFLEKKIRHCFKGGTQGLKCLCFHAPGMHFRG